MLQDQLLDPVSEVVLAPGQLQFLAVQLHWFQMDFSLKTLNFCLLFLHLLLQAVDFQLVRGRSGNLRWFLRGWMGAERGLGQCWSRRGLQGKHLGLGVLLLVARWGQGSIHAVVVGIHCIDILLLLHHQIEFLIEFFLMPFRYLPDVLLQSSRFGRLFSFVALWWNTLLQVV